MCRWVVYVPITTMSVIAAMEAFIRMRCVANINIIVAEVKKSIAVISFFLPGIGRVLGL